MIAPIVPADTRPNPKLPIPAEWPGSIVDRVAKQVRQRPYAPALLTPQGDWSYDDLDRQTGRLANALRAQGLGRGMVIAVHGRRGPALAWAILGILRARAAYVLLDPAYPLSWRQQQLRLVQPHACILVHSPGDCEVLETRFGCIRFEVASDAVRPDGDLFADAPSHPAAALDSTQPDDLAYIAFTSGTSGTPRGIVGTHRPLSHFLAWQEPVLALAATDRFILTAGMGTDLFIRELFTPWWSGGALFIPAGDVSAAAADEIAADLGARAITVAHFTPSTARLLCLVAAAPWSSLRQVCFAGEPLRGADVKMLRRQAPHAACVNYYGATETPQAMGYYLLPEESPTESIVPVGKGIDGVQLLVLTAGKQLAAIGEEGEICIRTPYLSREYLNDPAWTRERFVVSPWTGDPEDRFFRTGDVGRYLPDGSVAIEGRRDDQVKIRGFRIALAGVEAVLAAHPDVQETAVINWPESNSDARLVAYFVLRPAVRADPSTLLAYLRECLPNHMVPAILVPLERLPLTSRGKLDRAALPTPDGGTAAVDGWPKSPLELTLAALWREFLGRSVVGVDENFFDLGGHSLIATRIRSRIHQMGIPLKLRDIFDHPTIAGLATHLGGLGARPGTPTAGEIDSVPPPSGNVPASIVVATPAEGTALEAVKARYYCSTEPSPWFGRRACHLVIVINDRFHAEGFERLAAFVREWDPSITVTLVRDELQAVLPDIPGPTLVMSPAVLRQAHLRRGKVLCGFPYGKDEEYAFLEKEGLPVPRWALLAENVTPDLTAFSQYVVRKPNFGGRGAAVRLVRKDKLHWKPLTSPLGGTSATSIVQEFIWTGPRAVSYRVSCLCGEVVYCLRQEAHVDRPILEGIADIPSVSGREGFSIVASSRDSGHKFCYEEDIIALGEAASRAFPDIPLLGFDIVREVPSGKLYLMEANAIGYVWYFDQPQVSEYGFPLEAQFDGLRKAGRLLAERTQQLAS